MLYYDTKTGKRLWQAINADPSIGETVPAAPIAWDGMVYVGQAGGDYKRVKGRFYALDAKTGKVRWKRKAPGRISGAATVVGDIVYFGDLQSRSTTGLSARSGRTVFRFRRGGFNPVVSDGRNLYVVGYASLSQLRPRSAGR